MGFRPGAYATVWEVRPDSDTRTTVRLSISRKNKQTGEYEQDYSGFVGFVGTAAAKKAACLKERDRIKLGDTDVQTYYDKEKKVTYTNFKCFSFDTETGSAAGTPPAYSGTSPMEDMIEEGDVSEDTLPF